MKLVFVILAAALLSGCTIIKYKDGSVEATYISPAFGTKALSAADFKAGTITGFRSEQSQMVEVISAGVAAGVAKGLK